MKGVIRRRCETKLRKMLFCRMKEVLDTRVDMQLHSCNLSDIFVSFTDGNSLGQPSLAFKKTFTKAHYMKVVNTLVPMINCAHLLYFITSRQLFHNLSTSTLQYNTRAEVFYYVNYGLSIITSNVAQKIVDF